MGAIPHFLFPPINLSSTLSSASGTSNAQIGLNVSGGPTTLNILANPTAISLDQTDFSGGFNDPAVLEVILAVPFEYQSAGATETVFFDFDFDITSNVTVLGTNDSFLLQSCIAEGTGRGARPSTSLPP